MDQEKVARGVKWYINPPDAPWFGMAWEALVKSTKRTIKVMLWNVLTVDEVFLTVIAEAESHLNFRPLVYGGSTSSPADVTTFFMDVRVPTSHRVSSQRGTCRCVVDGVIVSYWLTNSGTVGGRSTCHI